MFSGGKGDDARVARTQVTPGRDGLVDIDTLRHQCKVGIGEHHTPPVLRDAMSDLPDLNTVRVTRYGSHAKRKTPCCRPSSDVRLDA